MKDDIQVVPPPHVYWDTLYDAPCDSIKLYTGLKLQGELKI